MGDGRRGDCPAMQQQPHRFPDGSVGFIVPEGFRLETKPPLEKLLPRVSECVTLTDVDSFVDYFNAYKVDEAVVFADVDRAIVTAVIDWHKTPGEGGYGDSSPGRKAHRVVYSFPYSEEWKRWCDIHRRALSQEEFLEFIEENAADVHEPSTATLMEVVANFRSIRSTSFKRSVRLSDGSVNMSFGDEDQTQQEVRVPSEIALSIPVRLGGERIAVKAFVRTRAINGTVKFLLVLHRCELVQQACFDEVVQLIEQATSSRVYRGKFAAA